MSSGPFLTKTLFSMGLECITRLHYRRNRDQYPDRSIDSPFLEALAEGGFQVGELAKYMFVDDPVAEDITIRSLNREEAVAETTRRLKLPGKVVIAEAAFVHESLLVRTDIIVKEGKTLRLYEVKAKSIDGLEDPFEPRGAGEGISGRWQKYLYDVAFQKFVASEAVRGLGLSVTAHIVLADKDTTASVDGLNQMFRIVKESGERKRVQVKPGLTSGRLGNRILRRLDVDDVVERILGSYEVPTDLQQGLGFREFVDMCRDAYLGDRPVYSPIGKKCKGCQFRASANSPADARDGLLECWENATHLGDRLRRESLVLELWGGRAGGTSLVQQQIDKRVYLLKDVDPADFRNGSNAGDGGLSPGQRRAEQVMRAKRGTPESYLDREGLAAEMDAWVYPLHMIDFETSMTALPFHAGMHPYEGIAFQFSHHVIEGDGSVRHAGQLLSFEPGVFPNYEFVRELKRQLESDEGTIFRYHSHENSYLNIIHRQLGADPRPPADRDVLQAFIRSITSWKETVNGRERRQHGRRCMVDLYEIVRKYYYSPLSRGSISIKAVLPAIIADSPFLRDKYGRPNYGKGRLVTSLNFDEKVWILDECGRDPYKTLDPLFQDYDAEQLDDMLRGLDEIKDGGAAMTAYNCLQFSEVPQDQREELRKGLLRYCELDTFAMVMIVEGWQRMLD